MVAVCVAVVSPWVDLCGCIRTPPELHDKWCAMLVCPRRVIPVRQMVCHTSSGCPLVCLCSVWIVHHTTASLESAGDRKVFLESGVPPYRSKTTLKPITWSRLASFKDWALHQRRTWSMPVTLTHCWWQVGLPNQNGFQRWLAIRQDLHNRYSSC